MQTHQDIWFSVENENEWVYFNTAHRPHPVMEFIPWPISVSSIIFSDGSQQYTAGGGAHTGMTPPSNPRPGELWFDPVSTQLFIWYVDGGFGQWVVTNNQPGGGSGTGATLLAGPGIALTPGVGTMTISNTAMGGSQTPWVSNIDGAQYDLLNVKNINVTQSYSINGVPFAVAGSINLTNINQISGVTGQPIAILSNTAITGTLTVNGNSVLVDPTTTLGDLLVRSATAVTRLPQGTNGQVLMVDTTEPNHLKWGTAGGTPAGANTEIQWNNNGVFGASPNLVWDNSYPYLLVTGGSIGVSDAAGAGFVWMEVDSAVGLIGSYDDSDDPMPLKIIGQHLTIVAEEYVQINVPIPGGGVGISKPPAYLLDVNGDCNISGTAPAPYYRINGIPFANANTNGTQINLTNVNSINGTDISGGIEATPAGANHQIQWNDNGAFGASEYLQWQESVNTLYIDSPVGTTPRIVLANDDGWVGRIEADPATGALILQSLHYFESRVGLGKAAHNVYMLDVNGDVNINGTAPTAVYRVNGVPLAFDATQIALSPGVSTWTTTQNAIAGMNSIIQTLARGMAYVGTFNAATNVATFVPSVGIAPGPLPAANAAGLHPGDFIIVTNAGTGPGGLGQLNVGDQLLTDGTNWDVIAVGHSLASVTAATVPLSPVLGTWDTVQTALTALNTLNANAVLTTGSYANPSWITSLDWSKISNAPAGANLWQTASGGRIYYSGGDVGIGTNDPQYTLDVDGDLNITGDFSINDIVFAAAGSVNLQATSITGLDGEPLLVNGDVTFELHGKIVSLEQVLNRLEFLEAQLSN